MSGSQLSASRPRYSKRSNHKPREVLPRRSSCDLPIIAVPALLRLAEWCQARRRMAPLGGSPCVTPEPDPSPPAPGTANDTDPAETTLAGSARRGQAASSANTQPRRGPATGDAPEPDGGVA